MNNGHTQVHLGCGTFAMILTLIFIVLKLTHYIDWNWFWVLSPILITTVSGLLFIGIVFVIMVFVALMKKE